MKKLATKTQTNLIDRKSLNEPKIGLQAEGTNFITELLRIYDSAADIYFVGKDLRTEKTIFLDTKDPIDFNALLTEGKAVSGAKTHLEVAFNIGQKCVAQKQRFVDIENGPQF